MNGKLALSVVVAVSGCGAVLLFGADDPADPGYLDVPASMEREPALSDPAEAPREVIRGMPMPSPRAGAEQLFSNRIAFDAETVNGRAVLDVLERHVRTTFASDEVRASFLGTEFDLVAPGAQADARGVLGAELLLALREQGFLVELRDDHLWVAEAADEV